MDALAGYGSDSDSSQGVNVSGKQQPTGALSGLLGNYSDESGDDAGAQEGNADGMVKPTEEKDDNPKKRLKRWGNLGPDTDKYAEERAANILPPPRLLADVPVNGDKVSHHNHFESLALFPKDHTKQVREKLSQQLKSQMQSMEPKDERQQQLCNKLDQMFQIFHQTSNGKPKTSFATHLKAQHEFRNPHLLKGIIDHSQIQPLNSNLSNSFKGFEYVDRLYAAEERSRIAAANFPIKCAEHPRSRVSSYLHLYSMLPAMNIPVLLFIYSSVVVSSASPLNFTLSKLQLYCTFDFN